MTITLDTVLAAYREHPQLALDLLRQLTKPAPVSAKPRLNEDQQKAWTALTAWLAGNDRFFALKGVAGSGKSFLMQHVAELPYNFHFCAPTNKAASVLADFLGTDVKTVYSLLGLRMTPNEDTLCLTAGKPPELGHNPIIVVDEAGMVPKVVTDILEASSYRVLLVGDPAQLRPVGESRSPAWAMAGANRVLMTKVERFDNQLLSLSVSIRDRLKQKDFRTPIKNNNDGYQGVFVKTKNEMIRAIKSLPRSAWSTTKIACWRNTTVATYNNMVRENLGFKNQYEVGEIVLLGSPVKELGIIKGYVDEELEIAQIVERQFTFCDGVIDGYVMAVTGKPYSLNVPKDVGRLKALLDIRAGKASTLKGVARKKAWDAFWELRDTFHEIRYGYAMTVHRLQGTTLNHIFVDQADVLANPDKAEAFRCLYVAATRPKVSLTTY